MSVRDFKQAGECFFDTMATFTSTELMDYRTFCKYAVFCCMVAMGRGEVKKNVSNHTLARMGNGMYLIASVPDCEWNRYS